MVRTHESSIASFLGEKYSHGEQDTISLLQTFLEEWSKASTKSVSWDPEDIFTKAIQAEDSTWRPVLPSDPECIENPKDRFERITNGFVRKFFGQLREIETLKQIIESKDELLEQDKEALDTQRETELELETRIEELQKSVLEASKSVHADETTSGEKQEEWKQLQTELADLKREKLELEEQARKQQELEKELQRSSDKEKQKIQSRIEQLEMQQKKEEEEEKTEQCQKIQESLHAEQERLEAIEKDALVKRLRKDIKDLQKKSKTKEDQKQELKTYQKLIQTQKDKIASLEKQSQLAESTIRTQRDEVDRLEKELQKEKKEKIDRSSSQTILELTSDLEKAKKNLAKVEREKEKWRKKELQGKEDLIKDIESHPSSSSGSLSDTEEVERLQTELRKAKAEAQIEKERAIEEEKEKWNLEVLTLQAKIETLTQQQSKDNKDELQSQLQSELQETTRRLEEAETKLTKASTKEKELALETKVTNLQKQIDELNKKKEGGAHAEDTTKEIQTELLNLRKEKEEAETNLRALEDGDLAGMRAQIEKKSKEIEKLKKKLQKSKKTKDPSKYISQLEERLVREKEEALEEHKQLTNREIQFLQRKLQKSKDRIKELRSKKGSLSESETKSLKKQEQEYIYLELEKEQKERKTEAETTWDEVQLDTMISQLKELYREYESLVKTKVGDTHFELPAYQGGKKQKREELASVIQHLVEQVKQASKQAKPTSLSTSTSHLDGGTFEVSVTRDITNDIQLSGDAERAALREELSYVRLHGIYMERILCESELKFLESKQVSLAESDDETGTHELKKKWLRDHEYGGVLVNNVEKFYEENIKDNFPNRRAIVKDKLFPFICSTILPKLLVNPNTRQLRGSVKIDKKSLFNTLVFQGVQDLVFAKMDYFYETWIQPVVEECDWKNGLVGTCRTQFDLQGRVSENVRIKRYGTRDVPFHHIFTSETWNIFEEEEEKEEEED
uniref:Uncharacterized protein n=1 Tax=Palpitomonas bilix TaxID=652834 RepID=A0A7S3DDB5_9EUKA